MILTPLFTEPVRIRLFLPLLAVFLYGTAWSEPLPANGRTAEREIQAGETQAYEIQLEAGQFLRVQLQENGSDLALRLLDPQGKPVAMADSLTRGSSYALEDLAAIVESTGAFQLQVMAGRKGARYVLNVQGPRLPEGNDRQRAEAVAATWKGLLEPGTADAATRNRILETALGLWQSLGVARKVAETQFSLGLTRTALGDQAGAVAAYQQAAEIWGREAGGFLEANAYTNLGKTRKKLGQREEAKQSHERAIELAHARSDGDLEAENLGYLSTLLIEEGAIRKSLDLQIRAVEAAHRGGNPSREANLLNGLAETYDELGETQKALTYYQKALELAETQLSPGSEPVFLNNVGDMYRTLGNWDKALEYFERAEERSRSVDRPEERGKLLINLSFAYRRHLGRVDEARKQLQEALRLGQQTGSADVQAYALMNLSALELEAGHPEPAVQHARGAVTFTGSLVREQQAHYTLGRALREVHALAEARSELEKSLALAQKQANPSSEAQCILALAQVFRDLGDPTAALTHLQRAIDIVESRREGVVSPELRTSFLAAKQDYYELQVDTLMELHTAKPDAGYAAKALRLNEQARARGLLEILAEAGSGLRQGASPALQAREQEAREEMNARDWYRRELLSAENPDPAKLAEADQRLKEAIDAYDNVQVQMREGNPRYASLTEPRALDLQEIRQQVLGGDAVLVEIALGTRRSFLWVVGPDLLRSFELPARDRIEAAARGYYELLTVRNQRKPGEPLPDWKRRIADADARIGKAGRELSTMLFQAAEPFLVGRALLLVADGALQYIPFAALPQPSDGEIFASRHEIVMLPSASALAVIRAEERDRARATQALAVIADPVFQRSDPRLGSRKASLQEPVTETRGEEGTDLSSFQRLAFSQKEAEAITALLPASEVLKVTGFDADRSTLDQANLARFRNVHFATHGVVDSRQPELSGLVLSLYNEKGERQDGFLRLHDIYNLHLNADLVVLSACRTALGREIRGEGLVGLTRGFMYAGATRVLATLWSVEDRATAELMASFYRGMLRDGLSPAAALRKAQLEMAKSSAHSSPYYWAGFSLQGEWR